MPLKIDEEYRVKRTRKSSVDRLYARQNSSRKSNSKPVAKTKSQVSNRSVVKVTSGCKGFKEVSNHIDYISRNGKVELRTSDGQILKGKKETFKAKLEMGLQNEKLAYFNDGSSKTKQTYNMVFSLKEIDKKDTEILLNSVYKVLKEKYPNNYFVYSLHEDSEHPHIHVCLNKRDIHLGKNINMDKQSLQEIKHNFSKELLKNNIQVQLEPKKRFANDKDLVKGSKNREKKQPTGVFELVAHGEAPYLNDLSKQPSYFVAYKTGKNKIVRVWGKDLERAIKASKAEIGDKIKLNRTEPDRTSSSSMIKYAATWQINVYEKSELSLKEKMKQEFEKARTNDKENKERKDELEL